MSDSKPTKRTVRCEHFDNISKCPPCWAEFTGSKSTEELCNHIEPEIVEWMESLGFTYTSDMGNGMKFNHKLFVRDGLHVFTEQAEFFYQELAKRIEEAKKLYNFEQNHHDALKGIDDYQKFSKAKPQSPERLAAWIHQLSPWNLERGVQALEEWRKEAYLDGQRVRQQELLTDIEEMTREYDSSKPEGERDFDSAWNTALYAAIDTIIELDKEPKEESR